MVRRSGLTRLRLRAPYVGLTLETTTSIIGAVLLGIAVGAGVGGWAADRTNPPRLVVGLLIVGGLLVASAGEDGRPAGDNDILFASNGPLPPRHGAPVAKAGVFERAAIVRLAGGARALTDDYAPVDQLETRRAVRRPPSSGGGATASD